MRSCYGLIHTVLAALVGLGEVCDPVHKGFANPPLMRLVVLNVAYKDPYAESSVESESMNKVSQSSRCADG